MKRAMIGILAAILVLGAGTIKASAASGHHGYSHGTHHARTSGMPDNTVNAGSAAENTAGSAPENTAGNAQTIVNAGRCGKNLCGGGTACCAEFADADGDGHCDNCDDNCDRAVCRGGLCDNCAEFADADGDGHCDNRNDNCDRAVCRGGVCGMNRGTGRVTGTARRNGCAGRCLQKR